MLNVVTYLQELCLHTKLLAPMNTMIADFLAKAPDPPAFLLTRNAVHILKVCPSSVSIYITLSLSLSLSGLSSLKDSV